jgi:predicted outer membrane repeat protein
MVRNLTRTFCVVLFPLVAAVGVMLAAQAAPVGGVVGTGTSGSCTEAALRAKMAGGGTVSFNCGSSATILVLQSLVITQATTLNGDNKITLTGGLATNLLYQNPGVPLAVSNITLDSAFNGNSSGGAIWSGGPLTLTHVTVQHSQTSNQYCGGALIVSANTMISDSTFASNTAGLGGGAICVRSQPGTRVQITRSFFSGNQAVDATNGLGGALYVEYGTANVLDSVFLFNSAHLGGAAYAAGGGVSATLTLQGSPAASLYASAMQLNGNSATEDGGAVYNKRGNVSIDNAVLTVNRTPTTTLLAGFGGAVYDEGVITVTNSIVSQNAGRFGGGMFVGLNPNGAHAIIDHVLFVQNISGNYGGGLYADIVTTTVVISNSVFDYNTASTGGGLARVNSAMRIANTSFTHNTAVAGGAMWIGALPAATDGPYVRVESTTISDNTATGNQGGGILNNGRAELYYMTIVTNTQGVYSYHGANTRFRDDVLQNPGYLNCDGDGSAQISDDTHNYSTDNSCVLPNSTTGTGLNPKLGPLMVDIFGPTYYRMPLAGSPLINAGSNCPARDQRGAFRPDACDIGAVEYGGRLPLVFLPIIKR